MTDTTRQADAAAGAPEMPNVDDLAQEIRRVDGGHSLGAGALAEQLMPFLCAYGQAMAEHARTVALEEGFEAGWRVVARDWAMRDDLLADIGSPAYLADMTRAIRAAAQTQGGT
jgi:hypothetical protein